MEEKRSYDLCLSWKRRRETLPSRFLRILYPHRCPLCFSVLPRQDRLLCRPCEKRLRPITENRCFICGRPTRGEEEYCRDCRHVSHVFTRGLGVFLYEGEMKESIRKYKRDGCREYSEFYARAAARYSRRELEKWAPDRLIYVPMYPGDQRKRGYNQSFLLARELSFLTGIPLEADAVRKIHPTKAQKKLGAAERRKNLYEAYVGVKKFHKERLLIVDDIYTTGSTMDAMAEVLLKAGASYVYFLTLCIVP